MTCEARQQIYNSYYNGQKIQYAEQVKDYGLEKFVQGVVHDCSEGYFEADKALEMLHSAATLQSALSG